jgi:hypothetical protein
MRTITGFGYRKMPSKNTACKILLIFFGFVLLGNVWHADVLHAQTVPSYSFVSFDKAYGSIIDSARREGYQVKEEEITSRFGKYHIFLEKMLNYYTENIYLFFNENKELVSFTVLFSINENQPRTVLDKLVVSISEKLTEKYGPNENETYSYFKLYENSYELVVRPRQSSSGSAYVTFKHVQRNAAYQDYYIKEVEELEDEEIEDTVNKF